MPALADDTESVALTLFAALLGLQRGAISAVGQLERAPHCLLE
jgi:hypothetical protein